MMDERLTMNHHKAIMAVYIEADGAKSKRLPVSSAGLLGPPL